MRRENFLFYSTDGKHQTRQRDLTRHRGIERTFLPVYNDARADAIVTPALGPSFGIARPGHVDELRSV
jgi:hypothetical protein